MKNTGETRDEPKCLTTATRADSITNPCSVAGNCGAKSGHSMRRQEP